MININVAYFLILAFLALTVLALATGLAFLADLAATALGAATFFSFLTAILTS